MVTWYDYTTHQTIALPAIGEIALCTLHHGDNEYRDVSVKIAGEWEGDAIVGISDLNPNFDALDAAFGSVVRLKLDCLRPLDEAAINFINNYLQQKQKPKRWTVEDQKAGRLPEVGAHFLIEGNLAEFIGLSHAHNNWCFRRLDGEYGIQTANKDWFAPIETPTEKAARLKSEWCAKAAKQLKNLEYTSTLTSIYDALLSGELKAPESTE